MSESIRESTEVDISNLARRGELKVVVYRQEIGPNHWYSLYEVRNPKIGCNGCSEPAKFLYFEKWHTGETETDTLCDNHAPESWKEKFNNRTAG